MILLPSPCLIENLRWHVDARCHCSWKQRPSIAQRTLKAEKTQEGGPDPIVTIARMRFQTVFGD